MNAQITVTTLERRLEEGQPLAILDVREQGEYGAGHLFLAVSLPYSQLEQRITALVPNRAAHIVIYDNGFSGVAEKARLRLSAQDYPHVWVLDGGAAAWAAAGYSLFEGVNVPPKAFGEQVEALRATPHISARQLADWQKQRRPLVILDGRPYSEYQKMSIPGALCCPNGELGVRIDRLLADETTPVVINCAGRTRSIIGAQTLIDIGVSNPVYALENGTQGWMLEDLPLEHQQQGRYGELLSVSEDRLAAACQLAGQHGVEWVAPRQVAAWQQERQTVYLLDVRTEEEFRHHTLPGAHHAPGGQLQQATDHYIAVRNAKVVLFDNDGVRAVITACWLRQMGHQAFVLQGGLEAGLAFSLHGPQLTLSPPAINEVTWSEIEQRQAQGERVYLWDLRSSEAWLTGHLAGSRWAPRPAIAALAQAQPTGRVVFISDNRQQAAWATLDLPDTLRADSVWLNISLYRDALISGEPLSDEERIDFLFFTHDRHEGNKAAARQYLQWEKGLWSRLRPSEKAIFKFPQ